MIKRLKQDSLFLDAAMSTRSEVIDFHIWFSPGFLMQQRQARQESFSLHRETKFLIGFDFAVTHSSPESFSVHFDITSEQLKELKWLMLNKHTR